MSDSFLHPIKMDMVPNAIYDFDKKFTKEERLSFFDDLEIGGMQFIINECCDNAASFLNRFPAYMTKEVFFILMTDFFKCYKDRVSKDDFTEYLVMDIDDISRISSIMSILFESALNKKGEKV